MQKILFYSLAFFLLTGCANTGKNLHRVRSDEARQLFESATVLPDHKYYYAGPSAQPDTIIAIHERYTFQKSVHWNEVDITEKQLQDWNRMIDNNHRLKYPYHGAYIMAPDGKKAGIGYSKYNFTVIQYPAPNQIIIWRPDPNPSQRRRNKF